MYESPQRLHERKAGCAENASWSCVNGLRCGLFGGGGCLVLFVIVDCNFAVVFCRFVGWMFSPSSSSRARLLDARAKESRTGGLDETEAIVLVRLWYVFLTVVAMAGNVVGFKW